MKNNTIIFLQINQKDTPLLGHRNQVCPACFGE